MCIALLIIRNLSKTSSGIFNPVYVYLSPSGPLRIEICLVVPCDGTQVQKSHIAP